MSTDALELALALHQAPIQRFALRDRPLPNNIGVALQLASATQPQLEQAATRFSESEQTLVEAARFYLQQVLFEPGTDAYRILGLAPNADFQQIRQHHIWLQRWLHPDRRGEDWEAALATKVNWAWQQLRSERVRAAYDRSRQRGTDQAATTAEALERVQVPAWTAAPIEPRRHWLRRVGVAGALVGCFGLFYLAATRQDRVDPEVLAVHSTALDSAIRPRLPFADEGGQPARVPLRTTPTSPPAPARADAGPAHATTSPGDTPASPTPGQVDSAPPAEPRTTAQAQSATPLQIAKRPRGDPPASSAGKRVNPTPVVRTEPAPIAIARVRASLSSASKPTEAVKPTPTNAVVSVAGGRPEAETSKAATPALASARREVAATSASDPIAPAPMIRPASASGPTLASTRKIEGEAPKPGQPITHSAAPEPAAVSSENLAQAALPADLAPDSLPSAQATPELPPAELDRATLARFELARARVRSMISYLRSPTIDPPAWMDESARHSVAREREALHERNAEAGVDRFVLDPPIWQISPAAVSLKAGYHIDAKRRSAETGRFRLDMIWHDDNWKISLIEISPGL